MRMPTIKIHYEAAVMGLEKTKTVFRQKVYFRDLDTKEEQYIKECAIFQALGKQNPPAELLITLTP